MTSTMRGLSKFTVWVICFLRGHSTIVETFIKILESNDLQGERLVYTHVNEGSFCDTKITFVGNSDSTVVLFTLLLFIT